MGVRYRVDDIEICLSKKAQENRSNEKPRKKEHNRLEGIELPNRFLQSSPRNLNSKEHGAMIRARKSQSLRNRPEGVEYSESCICRATHCAIRIVRLPISSIHAVLSTDSRATWSSIGGFFCNHCNSR